MNTRPMTAADIVNMIADASERKVGDYIEPLVNHGDGEWGRRALRIVADADETGYARYVAVDRFGRTFDVWTPDDPRPSTEAEFNAEEPMP